MPDKKRADPSRRSFLTKVSAGLLGSSARLGRCLSAASCFSAGASLLAQALNTIRPLELDVPLSNPYMGWGIWAGPQQYGYSEAQFTATDNTAGFGDDTSLFSWVMIDWPWHKLEPKESHYDWSEFDKVTKFWTAHGKQLVVRLWVTDDAGWNKHPGGAVIPEWVWKKGVGYREYKGESDVVQREPDYLAPSFEGIYLPALRGLLNSFAANYDKANSPFIFMQIMGYGQWADWATWYSHYPWPSDAIKHEHLSKIVALFASTFKNIPLLIPYMGDWDNQTVKTLDDHLYRMAINEALKADTGLIFTGFIEGLSAQPWTEPTTERFWRQRALVGEGWSYQEIKKDGTHGTLDENLDGALEYHTNLFHYYVDSGVYPAAIRDDKAHFERGLKRGGLGYRLVLAEASWPQRLRAGQLLVIQQKWRNRNVGRLYVRHYLRLFLLSAKGDEKFSFTDNNFDPTPYVDGQEYSHLTECHLPDNWPPGTYELRIALVDRENQPVIRLAIAGEDAKLRFSLGTVQILSPTSEIALV